MPESIVGGGKTLSNARAEYHAALRFSIESALLPTVTEYVEREVGNSGIWLRLPIDFREFDSVIDRINGELAEYPEDRQFFFANTTAGGDPIVIAAASPNDPVSSIIDQMTTFDCVILAMQRHTHAEVQNVWIALAGAETEHGAESPATFASMGITRESRISDLLEVAVQRHVNKMSALVR